MHNPLGGVHFEWCGTSISSLKRYKRALSASGHSNLNWKPCLYLRADFKRWAHLLATSLSDLNQFSSSALRIFLTELMLMSGISRERCWDPTALSAEKRVNPVLNLAHFTSASHHHLAKQQYIYASTTIQLHLRTNYTHVNCCLWHVFVWQ